LKIIHRTYRFALRPTKTQEVLLNKHFGCVRYVYNHFLEEKIRQYRDTGKSDHYPQQAACLTQLKRQQETCWLREINNQALQASLRHLDTAFMRFYPSSKTCHACGYVHQDLTLSERSWVCPNGHVLDRDLNASKNILKQGLAILSSGTTNLHGWRLR
jgi:putative transposase